MSTRTTLLLLIASLPVSVLGQTGNIISGQVTNKDGKSISTAVVVLRNATDTLVLSNTTTDKNGLYKISTEARADVVLNVEATGYNPEVKAVATVTNGMVVNFSLSAAKSLSEVTVVARKPLYEQKADRTIFNVESSVAAQGGDAMDALKKTPSVIIMNNQVTIAGKSSVGVMLNGRIQQLGGEDLAQLLHSIPTDNLSKIEVITTPPARYDAEGNAGLINLVTKKNLKEGLKGSLTASYNQNSFSSPSISTSLNYRREKLNLYCNASTGLIGWKYTNRTSTYYPGQTWEQKLDMGSVTHMARLQLGMDYNLTKSSVIGIVVSDNYSKLDNDDSLIQKSFSPGEIVDSVMHTKGHTGEVYQGKYALNLNYEWRIDSNGKKLNVDLDYYTHEGQRTRDFYVHNYAADGSLTGQSTNRMNGSPSIAIKSIKADMEFPTKPVRLSFGIKASHVDNKMDNVYEALVGDHYQVDLTKTNAFSYTEDIQAAYLTAQKTIGKFELQLGLRAEHTATQGYSATLNQTTTKDYTQLFPSGYIQYTPSEDHVLSMGYSRRINRPAYNFLNPFRFYYSPNSYAEGNPNLQPSIRNGMEFGYSIKAKYFIKAWAVQVDNYWDRIIETDTLTSSTSVTRANLGRARFLGANFNVVSSPAKWWESRSGISFEYNDFRLSHFGNTSNLSSFLYWIETENSFFLNKKRTWSAEVNGYYYAPRQKDYKRWESMLCVNVGVRATFLDRNLIVGLNGDDIFGTTYWLQTNSANGTREYTYDDERSVRLSVTYKFGNKNVKNKRDRNLSTEEMQRANQQ